MNSTRRRCGTMLLIILSLVTSAAAEPFAQGPYLGQIPPGPKAVVFAPNLICRTGTTWESNASFSLDGKTFCYMRSGTIFFCNQDTEGWNQPRPVPGLPSGAWSPVIDPTGKALYFTKRDLYRCHRMATGWSAPEKLPPAINSSTDEWGFSLAADNSLYFCSHRSGGRGGCDVWTAPFVENTWPAATLVSAVDTGHNDCGPAVAADQSFMVLWSNRPGGQGGFDLYLSRRLADGTWSEARNLGPGVNTPSQEVGAHISPDQTYLFFTRSNGWNPSSHAADIYWVKL